jgi:hypothetical protein
VRQWVCYRRNMMRNVPVVAAASVALAGASLAHHSYAMFDSSKTLTVSGTVAKLEWMNPHVFIWVHVRNPDTPGGYDLYAFENGSTNVLARKGWTKTTLQSGEKVSIEYWPLKDGRSGGHFLKAVHNDGRVSWGAGGPNGGAEARVPGSGDANKQNPK